MSRRYTLPALGAVLVGSAVLGVHLGNSAVASINPLYFQGAPVHPRDRGTAIQEPVSPKAPLYAGQYSLEDGIAAREEECGAPCASAMQARLDYPSVYMSEERHPARFVLPSEPARPAAKNDWAEEQDDGYDVEYAEVQRYASFAVAKEEAEPVDLQE